MNTIKPNEEYSSHFEDKGYALLEDFNNAFLHLQGLGRTPYSHTTDASGYTTDGRYMNIELKIRRQRLDEQSLTISADSYTADTIFIETHKVGDMLLDYLTLHQEPLYVNFLEDGIVVVYNLSRLSSRPRKTVKKIYSNLYKAYELAKREELPIKEAYIYKRCGYAYKLIHKPNS